MDSEYTQSPPASIVESAFGGLKAPPSPESRPLYSHGEVLADEAPGDGQTRELDVRLSEKDLGRFVAMGQ